MRNMRVVVVVVVVVLVVVALVVVKKKHLHPSYNNIKTTRAYRGAQWLKIYMPVKAHKNRTHSIKCKCWLR